MTASPPPDEDPKKLAETECQLHAQQQQDEQEALNDPVKQEQYRQEYLRQRRRVRAPGAARPSYYSNLSTARDVTSFFRSRSKHRQTRLKKSFFGLGHLSNGVQAVHLKGHPSFCLDRESLSP